MCAKGHIVAAPQLDDPGDPHEIDTGLEVEAPDDRRARYDQNLELGDRLRKGVCNGSAPADMPQAKAVVAVNQHAGRGFGNDEPLGSLSVTAFSAIISRTGTAAKHAKHGKLIQALAEKI